MGAARVRVRRASGRLTAQTIDELAEFVVTSIGTAQVRELEVRLQNHRLPRGWIGSPTLHGLVSVAVTPQGDGVDASVAVEGEKDIAVLASAIYRMLSPVRGPRGTFTSALPASAGMLAPAVRDVFADDIHLHLRRADDVFGSLRIDGTRHIEPQADGDWMIDGWAHHVWVDPAVHRPLGRASVTALTIADVPAEPWLDRPTVASLRDVACVRGIPSPIITAQLHASGVLLESEIPGEDPFALQVASVRARRESMRQFSWVGALDAWPSVSAVLVTNRTTHLERIVATMRTLRYPRLQIVIGLHGVPKTAVQLEDLDASVVELDGSLTFGAAMQQACRFADGELITKIDDDDIYGPEHIWDLVLAKRYSGAELVGKALDWIYLADEGVTTFRPVYAAEKYGKFVAGGTIMIDRGALDAIGGWRPVPRSIDRALLDSVRADGGLVYRTHGLGYVYVRRSAGHTAQVDNAHFRTRTVDQIDGLIAHAEFGTG